MHQAKHLLQVKDLHTQQQGLQMVVCTFVNDRIQKSLPLFGDNTAKVVAKIDAKGTGFTEQAMKLNSQGVHWFSIAGHNRINKSLSPFDFPNGLIHSTPQHIRSQL
jgi:hypothetical protein